MTCTLFTYIYSKLSEDKKNKFLNKIFICGAFWKFKYDNNYNKFTEFYNYVNSEPEKLFLYNKEEYIDAFCHIQKIYHAFLKLKNVVKYKYYKKYNCDEDLLGNKLSDIKDTYKIKLIENNTVYNLSLKDLLKNISTLLTYNEGYFLEPRYPINPFTGLQLSKHNLYNIYFAYKKTFLRVQMPLEHFFICDFNLKNYKKYSEGLVNHELIRINVKNMEIDEFKLTIKRLFRQYTCKPPNFCDDFPKQRIRDIFNPYVQLFMYIKYGQDKNRVFWSKKLLKQQVKRFSNYMRENNPIFGRVIRKLKMSKDGKSRVFKKVVVDDHVRWDRNFPYIKENKELPGFGIFRTTYGENDDNNQDDNQDAEISESEANTEIDDSDDEEVIDTPFSTGLPTIRHMHSETNYFTRSVRRSTVWDNLYREADIESSPPFHVTSLHGFSRVPSFHFEPRTPPRTPQITPPITPTGIDLSDNFTTSTIGTVTSIDLTNNLTTSTIGRSYDIDLSDDFAVLFEDNDEIDSTLEDENINDISGNQDTINNNDEIDSISEHENINDISGNQDIINNNDELQSYINNNPHTINEINNNVMACSILTRLIQIRMFHLNSSSDTIYSLLDQLITNQIKIIAGKLLVKYLSNQLSDSMRETVINTIIADEGGGELLSEIISNLQTFHDNITVNQTESDNFNEL
jgi:hypothetical protein